MRAMLVIVTALFFTNLAYGQSLSELERTADAQGVSDLEVLEGFKDIAVIQRRFLPKTSRFEGSVALGTVTNDPFFDSTGLMGKIGYYFTEAYGVEFHLWSLRNSANAVTEDLSKKRGVNTAGLVKPTFFYGVDFRWNPIYGKMTLFNERIIPFDLYFSAGLGNTHVEYDDSSLDPGSAPTLHLATGQVFAISKSTAFRWDFSLNNLSVKDDEGGISVVNNLFISVGMSFFFPEAKYR